MTLSAATLWFLVSIGSTLIVTHGSIFASFRAWLPEGNLRTLVSCPMCTGFWMGAFWSFVLTSPVASLTPNASLLHVVVAHFADACAASAASALFVSAWLLLARFESTAGEVQVLASEAKHAANLWRYMNTKDPKQEPPDTTQDPSQGSVERR